MKSISQSGARGIPRTAGCLRVGRLAAFPDIADGIYDQRPHRFTKRIRGFIDLIGILLRHSLGIRTMTPHQKMGAEPDLVIVQLLLPLNK